jgi:hypothetical protein
MLGLHRTPMVHDVIWTGCFEINGDGRKLIGCASARTAKSSIIQHILPANGLTLRGIKSNAHPPCSTDLSIRAVRRTNIPIKSLSNNFGMAPNPFFAVVAGVGEGTGAAVARVFARRGGYPVVLLARSQDTLKEVAGTIEKEGGKAIPISTDISDAASVKSAFESIKKELGQAKLAVAVYNVAAGFGRKPFLELTSEDLDRSYNGNV